MAEHTKEPWKMITGKKGGDRQEQDCLIVRDFGSSKLLHIAETFQYQNHDNNQANGTSTANAHHIVACVNACADIPKPEAIPKLVKALKEWKNSFANGISTRKLFAALREAGIK